MRSLGSSLSALSIVGVIALTLLPLPPTALDILLAFSLGMALLTFMVALYVERPLEFSSFPSLLLLVTLLRLSLNIATTRRILLHGNEGLDAAGGMIRAFGEFAVGGNFVVGAVVFIILVVVNFIVITKGAERISEVAARFTLDSLPGKQMAIDADLGAGLVTEAEARERRRLIEREADFYGTMDGASKFVRGDAIAGLLITAINILGGIIVGVGQHGLSFSEAATTFTVLSIGDGLVSQLPALFVSTGAALLTTRTGSGGDFSSALGVELFSRNRPVAVAAAALALVGLMPGMPLFVLLTLAAGLYALSRRRPIRPPGEAEKDSALEPTKTTTPTDPAAQKAEIEAMLPVDLLALDVSLDILPLVDVSRSGELLTRIASLRKQLAMDLGVIVPPVHVEDDLLLPAGSYRIRISGTVAAQGRVRTGRLLAIDPSGEATARLPGEVVREPTFGLPAKWLAPGERRRAEEAGCTVVDASAVIATHLTQVIRQQAHELLGRREAQELIELTARRNEKLVEELIPNLLSLGEVIKVFRNLLREGVSIRDTRTILETLADHASQTKEPRELTELVRGRLARQITHGFLNDSGELHAMILDPILEDLFRPQRGVDPQALSKATESIEAAAHRAAEEDAPAVLVVAPDVRTAVSEVAQRHVPGLSVLSYREIDPSVPFVTRSIVNGEQEARA